MDNVNPEKGFRASSGPVPKVVKRSIVAVRKSRQSNTDNTNSTSNRKRSTHPSNRESTTNQAHQSTIAGIGSTNVRTSKVDSGNRILIPGNARASLVPVSHADVASTRESLKSLLHESAHPSILQLQNVSPSALQMESMRQNEQLNRLASVRHSLAVQGMNTNAHLGIGATVKQKVTQFSVTQKNEDTSGSHFQSRRKFTILKPEDADDPNRNEKLRPIDSDWEVVTSVRANDLYGVTKYKSLSTGMEIIHSQLESPTVHGYFVVATNSENDWGLTHILQHMIFLGSKSYPFPGVLDQLASKCLASGTSGWTESDHSCFTVTTAGKEGFLSLLPIYMDHIFFPILGEAAYLTEVHNIDGEGKDGGVCYLEMKAIEHDPSEQAHWALIKLIYKSESGYYHHHEGLCKDMRESCTLQAVKSYHKKFYHPKNLCLIICGHIEKEDIFNVVNPFMETLKEGNEFPETWEKPWVSEPPIKLEEDVESTIHFPSDREENAFVKIGIVGPCVTQDVAKSIGFQLLMQYLLNSPVAPVQKEFVHNEHPLASHVSLSEINHVQTIFCLNFENVKIDDMESVPSTLRNLLVSQTQGGFDLERMNFIVHRCYQEALSGMENDPEKAISRAVISDFLYGSNDELMFDRRINRAYIIEQFVNQPASYWTKMIQHLAESKWATVYTVPCKEARQKYLEEEEVRVTEIMEKIGTTGKQKLNARLKAAHKIQARPPPPELLNCVHTPPISSIGFLAIARKENPSWASETMCNLYLDDINSSYIYLTVMMDTSELTVEEKKYLVLFSQALVQSPYVDSSERYYTCEQMVAGLNRDVLHYETFFGIDWDSKEDNRFTCGSYSHLFCIRFQLEMKKVKEGFEWMQILLWNTKWQADRLKIIAQGMAADVNNLEDHGSVMTHALLKDALYQMNSNVKAINLIRQKTFLKRIASDLPKSFKKVAKKLETIRMVILRPENTTVHVATSLLKMQFYLTDKPEVRDAIAQLLRRSFDYTGWNWGYETKRLANTPDHRHMRDSTCVKQCAAEKILRMHTDEGSYLIQAAPCLTDFNDPDYPLILAAIQYFCQHQGPFHKGIKSPGFASGYFMKVKPNEGMIYFELKPCSDLVGAYCAAFDIIVAHLDKDKETGEGTWSESLLQSAKSSLIFELIELENTPRNLAMQSLLFYYQGVDSQFSRRLMESISEVRLEDIKTITRKYLRPLFIQTTTCAVAAPVEKVPAIIRGLMDHCGKRLSLLPPVHQSEMADFTF